MKRKPVIRKASPARNKQKCGQEKNSTLAPGSDAALDAGCRCPVLDNEHGRGMAPGVFVMNEDCPLHRPTLTPQKATAQTAIEGQGNRDKTPRTTPRKSYNEALGRLRYFFPWLSDADFQKTFGSMTAITLRKAGGRYVEQLRRVAALVQKRIDICEAVIRADCEDEERACKIAKRVLPAETVDGDSYGVPSMSEIVELLVREVEKARRESEWSFKRRPR